MLILFIHVRVNFIYMRLHFRRRITWSLTRHSTDATYASSEQNHEKLIEHNSSMLILT